MNRPTVVISLVAVFLIGLSLGLMGGIVFARYTRTDGPPFLRRGSRSFGRMAPGAPGMKLDEALPRLQHMLELSPEQVARIRPRVLESQRQFDAARESLRSRIDAELTPQQRQRFEKFHRRHRFPGAPPDFDEAHPAPPGDEGEPR